MTNLDDLKRTIRRNKLLGMWATEKLGIRRVAVARNARSPIQKNSASSPPVIGKALVLDKTAIPPRQDESAAAKKRVNSPIMMQIAPIVSRKNTT
jgi:hypothetical protein